MLHLCPYYVFSIGNAGGYLGLFLGYTLLNAPDFLEETYNWILEKYKGNHGSKRNCQSENDKNEDGQQDGK